MKIFQIIDTPQNQALNLDIIRRNVQVLNKNLVKNYICATFKLVLNIGLEKFKMSLHIDIYTPYIIVITRSSI